MLKRYILIVLMLGLGLEVASAGPCLNAFQAAEQNRQAFLKDKSAISHHDKWVKLIDQYERIPQKYPGCEKADDALVQAGKLWLECAKFSGSTSDQQRALNDFGQLLTKYPKSAFADVALWYRGQILMGLGQKENARKEFKTLVARFPKTSQAVQAKKYLDELGPSPAAKAEKSAPPNGSKAKPQNGSTEHCEEPQIDSKPVFSSESAGDEKPTAPARAPLRSNDAIAILLEKNGTGAPSPEPAQLENLRYWSAPSYTRIVLDLDHKAEITGPHLLMPDPSIGTPPRIYFDLLNTRLASDFRSQYTYKDNCYELSIGDGLLRRARAGQYKPDVVRVVLDLQSVRDYKNFALPNGEDGGWRVIIDVYGQQKAAQNPPQPQPAPGPQPTPLPVPYPQPGVTATNPPLAPVPKPAPMPSPKTETAKPLVIVIDPGHGGKDPGAIGKKSTKEKDVVLAVAQDLESELKKSFPDAKIMLTRKDDRFIPLVERTAKANALAADYIDSQDVLFVSLHCNANPDRRTSGIETYYLDNTTDRATLRLAAQENFVSEEAMKDAGSDTTNKILADLATTSKVNLSIPLADSVQKELVKEVGSRYSAVEDHGVKKAPFWVLTGATMPAVLVEMSFISNPTEEKRLCYTSYQKTLAKGIATGIKAYEKKLASGQVVTN